MSTERAYRPGGVPASLIECFSVMPDPRVDRTRRHLLVDVVVIGFCATLAGGEGFSDMEAFGKAKEAWFRTFLELPGGIPTHDTFNRVFQALNPQAFFDCFLNWTESLRTAVAGEIVAVDGKALRRALDRGAGQALPYMVSAWATDNGLALGQVKVDEKSNEITAIPVLLRALELAGCIVTIDAMGCQKKIAREIVDADADYALSLKGNQETVHDEVKGYLDDAVARWAKAPTKAGKENEIRVRIATEQFRIRNGMPPTKPGYRKKDGTVDEDFIRKEVEGSPVYNPPAGAPKVIGTDYEGTSKTSGWKCP